MAHSMNPVSLWLHSLGFGRYADAFAAQDITFDVLADLTDADLELLGVATLGDRKRLLKAASILSSQADAPTVESVNTNAPPVQRQEAERRQLTVMFCDMVGSTQLSGRLDPEDLQEVVRRFHAAVASAVAPYEGHVAQYLGDGVLVYFGYPRAHEDDAERAARAALNVLGAVRRLRPHGDIELQTRIGIATGLVVVGEIGAGTSAAEQTASGEAPNLAARLQVHAGPGEIVVADETRRLTRASFQMQPLGGLALKGFAAPVEAWRLVGERSVASRFEAQHESDLIQLIGREGELSLLMERWALAADGEGQVVMLAGEAGIGKSRVVHAFRERLAGEPVATMLLQCSPYFSSSALYPLVHYFERVSGIVPADSNEVRTEKLARLTGSEIEFSKRSFGGLLRLIGLPDGGRASEAEPDVPRVENAALLQAPIDLLRGLANLQPVLLLVEDAHWIDPTTESLIAQAIGQLIDARVFILITARPGYAPSWGNPANLTRLTLNRLGHKQCVALVSAVTRGKSLPPEVLAEIVAKTDGIPLFVEELTKTVVQSGVLEAAPSSYRLKGPLPAFAIPSTLQDSLMARLDRLASAKEVAQVSALIGREFSRRLLAAVLKMPDAELDKAIDDLVRAELVLPNDAGPNASYRFKHALIRDTASSSLLKSQWALRHRQIAAAIEQSEPDTVASQPELIAHHYEEGGDPARAFQYWTKAGDLAAARGAIREAATHFRAALNLLPRVEDCVSPDTVELELRMKLGSQLMQIAGFAAPQTLECYTKARELASHLARTDEYAEACSGLGLSLWSLGRYRDAIAMLEQLPPEHVAQLKPMSRAYRTFVLALAQQHLGNLSAAWKLSSEALRELKSVELEQRQAFAGPGGADPVVVYLMQCVTILVFQGHLDQADALTAEALEVADRRPTHDPTRVWALSLSRWRAFRHGDMAESIRVSRELLEMVERKGFSTRLATGQMLLGRALVAAGQVEEGRRLLHEGYAMWASAGALNTGSEYASQAAEVLLDAGCVEDALEFVRAGEKVQADIEERYFEAELLRQRGRLAELGMSIDHTGVVSGVRERAEPLYRHALEAAERQGAKLFSLRAANDLARFLQEEGRGAEVDAVLRPIYAWFTEGLGHPELVRARALLGN